MTQPNIEINYHLMRVSNAIIKIKDEYENSERRDKDLIVDFLKKELSEIFD